METHESTQQCEPSPLFQRFFGLVADSGFIRFLTSENIAPLNTAAITHNTY
jgi:hypothetical protein